MHKATRVLILGVGLAAAFLCACSDDPVSPGIQPEVVNTSDAFGYQVSAVQNFTGAQQYTWTNAGNAANLNQATFRSGGSGVVRILDAGANQVVALPLGENGSFDALPGATGDWTIRVEYKAFSGTVNFRAEKTSM